MVLTGFKAVKQEIEGNRLRYNKPDCRGGLSRNGKRGYFGFNDYSNCFLMYLGRNGVFCQFAIYYLRTRIRSFFIFRPVIR